MDTEFDAESLMTDLSLAEMTDIETVAEYGIFGKSRSFVLRETKTKDAIYEVIKRKVNQIFSTYSKENPRFLNRIELIRFLTVFLRSH